FIDGGVAINHPAMAAVSFAINQHDSEKAVYCHRSPHSKGLKLKVNDLRVLSLGCGTSNGNYIPPQSISTGDWGIFQWKDYIADLLTETNVSASEYYVKQVLAPDDYWRCQLRFDAKEAPVAIRGKKMGLDVTSKTKLKAMKAFAEQYYETNKKKLLRFLGLRQKRRS
ncbi:MAG: patatin, partial [Bacteroidota bacterium]